MVTCQIVIWETLVWEYHPCLPGCNLETTWHWGGGTEEASLTLLKPLAKLSLTSEHAGRAPTEQLYLIFNSGGCGCTSSDSSWHCLGHFLCTHACPCSANLQMSSVVKAASKALSKWSKSQKWPSKCSTRGWYWEIVPTQKHSRGANYINR